MARLHEIDFKCHAEHVIFTSDQNLHLNRLSPTRYLP